jgi:hypothetical protein
VTKCNFERSNRFRNTVQLTIQLIPAECYDLIRISHGRFVKSATALSGGCCTPLGSSIATADALILSTIVF